MPELNETLVSLTADIVSAHVANNSVAVNDLPNLIANVHGALSGLGQMAAPEPVRAEPKVSVRSSVKPDFIVCLDCGQKQKMLKRHIMTAHGETPAQYRARWSLNADYPMVAPNYAEQRRALAVKIGLGRKPGQNRGKQGAATKAAGAAKGGAAALKRSRAKLGGEAPPAAS